MFALQNLDLASSLDGSALPDGSTPLVAGVPVTLEISLRDLYDNIYNLDTATTAVLTHTPADGSREGESFTGVYDAAKGVITVTYMVTYSGSANVVLTLTNSELATPVSTTWVNEVASAPASAANTVVTQISPSTAGGAGGEVTIVLQDRFGNPVTSLDDEVVYVEMTHASGSPTLRGTYPASSTDEGIVLVPNGAGGLDVIYTSNVAGGYDLVLQVDGELIADPTYAPGVDPQESLRTSSGPVDPQATQVTGSGLVDVQAGVTQTITISTTDIFGNPSNVEGAVDTTFTVLVGEGADARYETFEADSVVFDPATGEYTVSFTPTVSGALTVDVAVGDAGQETQPIPDFPVTAVVDAGPPSAQDSGLSGAGTAGAVIGQEVSLSVALNDANGNRAQEGGAPVRADIQGADADVAVIDNGDGTYAIDYRITSAPAPGQEVFLIILMDGQVVTSGCEDPVEGVGCRLIAADVAGNVDLTKTLVSGSGFRLGQANGPAADLTVENVGTLASGSFTITLRDSAGIQLADLSESFSLTLDDSDEGTVVVPGVNGPGTYTFYYARTRAGEYSRQVILLQRCCLATGFFFVFWLICCTCQMLALLIIEIQWKLYTVQERCVLSG